MEGFWRILVFASENKAVAVMLGSETTKSVALRLPMRFRLIEPVLPEPVPLDEELPLVVELLRLSCTDTVAVPFVPTVGLMPRLRFLSLLICMTATSTTTSGLERSRSLISFSASST